MSPGPALPRSQGAYRPEIDGLRAIAVIAVILFHARVPGFEGGFLGVDIFFVISGYLITGLICRDLAAGRFSLGYFYERRIRRILPALNVTMLLCILPAWYLMLPDDLENFGQSLIATAAFANNVLLSLTTDYFSLAAEFKPLVHTWSLGVEEQYYLFVPLILWGAYKLGRRMPAVTIAIATALSFAFCLYLSWRSPVANFYLPYSRIWALGVGGLVALAEPRLRAQILTRPGLADALAALGLLLALAPILLIADGDGAPDERTLAPVAGVALVLLFARSSGAVGKWLAIRPLVGLGLISFSLYLYHQPVFAFVRIASLDEPSPWLLLAFLPLILGLAWLSWRWVETPFRDRRRPFSHVLIMVGATTTIVVGAGAAFHFTSGFYRDWPELAVGDPSFGPDQNRAFVESVAPLRRVDLPQTAEQPRLLVLGDSFASDFINMGRATAWLDGKVVALAGVAHCGELSRRVLDNAPRADLIVIAYNLRTQDIPCVMELRERLRSLTRARIVILGPKSFGWNNNAVMRLPASERYAYRALPLATTVEANEAARALLGSDYVDLLAMLDSGDGRVAVFTPDRKFISQDRWHVTEPGAAYVGALLFRHPAFAAADSAD